MPFFQVLVTLKYIFVYDHLFSSYVLILNPRHVWAFYLSIWTCLKKASFPQKSVHSQRCLLAGWDTLKTDSELLVSVVATSSPCVVCHMLQQFTSNHSAWPLRGPWPRWNCGCPETMLCHRHSKVFLRPQCSRASTGHWVWERAAGLAVTPTSAPIPASFICPFKQLARVRDCRQEPWHCSLAKLTLGFQHFPNPWLSGEGTVLFALQLTAVSLCQYRRCFAQPLPGVFLLLLSPGLLRWPWYLSDGLRKWYGCLAHFPLHLAPPIECHPCRVDLPSSSDTPSWKHPPRHRHV